MSELLEDMYRPSVEGGIPSDHYWSLTLEEILVQSEANKHRKENEIKQQASMDYRLGQIMMFAVNDPNKMPKIGEIYPFFEDETDVISPEEQAMQEMRREQEYMILQAQLIKATRERRNANKK